MSHLRRGKPDSHDDENRHQITHKLDPDQLEKLLCFIRENLKPLAHIEQKLDKVMSALEDAQAALAKINAATNRVAAIQEAEAAANAEQSTTLQTISDKIDALLTATPGLPPAFVTAIQAEADKVEAQADVSEQLSTADKAQAEFSKGIASKGVADPVPVEVPTEPIP